MAESHGSDCERPPERRYDTQLSPEHWTGVEIVEISGLMTRIYTAAKYWNGRSVYGLPGTSVLRLVKKG